MIKTTTILILFLLYSALSQQPISLPPKPWNQSNQQFLQFFKSGPLNGVFSPTQFDQLYSQLLNMYPNILHKQSIGETYENRDIIAYFLNTDPYIESQTKSILFISGMHANQVVTYSQTFYLLLNLLDQENTISKNSKKLNQNIQVIIIPQINIDSFQKLYDYYNTHHEKYLKFRKNQHPTLSQQQLQKHPDKSGVDLNRNWDVQFNNHQITETVFDVADQEYHGDYPFSEPETLALKEFIQNNSGSIKYVLNLHSYGNLFVTPFNYDSDPGNPHLFKDMKFKAEKYQFIQDNFRFPKGIKVGNAINTVHYLTSGQFTDYISENFSDIIVASPQAGDDSVLSRTQFPSIDQMVKIVRLNYYWMEDLFKMAQGSVVVKEFTKDQGEYVIKIKNIGLAAYKNNTAKIETQFENSSVVQEKSFVVSLEVGEEKSFKVERKVQNITAIVKETLTLSVFNKEWTNNGTIRVYQINKPTEQSYKGIEYEEQHMDQTIYQPYQSVEINRMKTTIILVIIGTILVVLVLVIVFCAISRCSKDRDSNNNNKNSLEDFDSVATTEQI